VILEMATVTDRRDGELKIACTKPLHRRWLWELNQGNWADGDRGEVRW
jgi:hypothetical protein